jgi:hypothetical protein
MKREMFVIFFMISVFTLVVEASPEFKWRPEIGFLGSLSDSNKNWRPMVGVLTQQIDDSMRKASDKLQGKTSYIMASYINAL